MSCGVKILEPGARKGTVSVPRSKSHEHRLLIANFLAGETAALSPCESDNADIIATKRCLAALATDDLNPKLDCGESGSTLRFLAPVAAALGKRPKYIRRGRLAERPFKEYASLVPGVHALAGNVSSQFVTGLLFALPLLKGDSEIRFTSPLESRGYVEMTLRVIRNAGVKIEEAESGYRVMGNQRYLPQSAEVEGDWSGAAFWYGMNALGSDIEINGLAADSAQPDRIVAKLCERLPTEIDISQFPDNFPVLAVVAAGTPQLTTFKNIARLRLKECDRVAAMKEMLQRLGVEAGEHGAVSNEQLETVQNSTAAHCSQLPEHFVVRGTDKKFRGCEIRTFNDHRIAMAAAVAATRASGPIAIDNAACCAKSYPGFFQVFESFGLIRALGMM